MRKIFCLLALFGMCLGTFSAQNTNLLKCLEIIGFHRTDFIHADLTVEGLDSLIDIKSGYYELSYHDGYQKQIVCQAAQFNNADGTTLLVISGYYSDEQCSNHMVHFYEISTEQTFTPIAQEQVLPDLNIEDLLSNEKASEVLVSYLPEIQDNYLDSTATITTVLNEVYDFSFILPQKGTTLQATLTVCDYIPTNQVSIVEKDWEVVLNSIQIVSLSYNKKLKYFILR